MQKCPVCKNDFLERDCSRVSYRKFVIHCPKCGAELRKKFDIKMLISLFLFWVSTLYANQYWYCAVSCLIMAIVIVVIYIKTPYEERKW